MNTRTHLLLCLFITFLSCFTLKAQAKKESHEKIRTYKIAYLTEKLNLTENEAQKFWPIYNKFDKKRRELYREERFEIRKKIKDQGGLENLSEKDSEVILTQIQLISQQKYEVKKAFHHKVSKILSFKKILLLQMSEHEFNRKLIKKLKGEKNKKRS
ncbi:sensor of ECF-type sigma factor [Tenacibaculum insulae]|uniref:sensor of ECF-type sigma factor n=1 Tax=Tenacibaculum insulae TaxID=2029677 RepID=UPI003AB49A27